MLLQAYLYIVSAANDRYFTAQPQWGVSSHGTLACSVMHAGQVCVAGLLLADRSNTAHLPAWGSLGLNLRQPPTKCPVLETAWLVISTWTVPVRICHCGFTDCNTTLLRTSMCWRLKAPDSMSRIAHGTHEPSSSTGSCPHLLMNAQHSALQAYAMTDSFATHAQRMILEMNRCLRTQTLSDPRSTG